MPTNTEVKGSRESDKTEPGIESILERLDIERIQQ